MGNGISLSSIVTVLILILILYVLPIVLLMRLGCPCEMVVYGWLVVTTAVLLSEHLDEVKTAFKEAIEEISRACKSR